MAQLVASVSGVVLGCVAEVMGSNLYIVLFEKLTLFAPLYILKTYQTRPVSDPRVDSRIGWWLKTNLFSMWSYCLSH